MYSESFHYGKGVNPADALPRTGLKQKRLEQEMMNIIAAELKEKEESLEQLRRTRYFDTTSGLEYGSKPLTENTVGRWVMRSQDGAPIAFDKTTTAKFCWNTLYNTNII